MRCNDLIIYFFIKNMQTSPIDWLWKMIMKCLLKEVHHFFFPLKCYENTK